MFVAWERNEATFEVEPVTRATAKILIGIPHRKLGYFDWFMAFERMQKPPEYNIVMDTGRPLDVTRNVMVSRALNLGYDWVFFLDDDVYPLPDTLIKLVRARVPIVSGIYLSRAPPHAPVARFERRSVPKEEFGQDELVEVDEVGLGCMLIHTDVFRKMGADLRWRCLTNHFEEITNEVFTTDFEEAKAANYRCKICDGALVANFFKHTWGTVDSEPLSEDFYFCQKAKGKGYRILIKADVCLEHQVPEMRVGWDGYVTPVKEGHHTP